MSSPQPRRDVPIPTSFNLAETQFREAIEELRRDNSQPPRFVWPDATSLCGPFLPGHLWTVGARPGNGKTTFLLNTFDALVSARWPSLYLTTEMKAEELRRLWAAMRLGYDVDAVLENAWDRLPANALDFLEREIEKGAMRSDVAVLCDLPVLNTESVARALKQYAVKEGFRFVFLDHMQRWSVKDLSQKTGEMGAAVAGLKATAVKFGLTVFLASQLGRPQDKSPLSEFQPAPNSALAQTMALESESNAIVMLHRQRKAGITIADCKAVMEGRKDVRELIEPGIMCASVTKLRHRPKAVGRTFRLKVRDSGRLDGLDSYDRAQLGIGPDVPDAPREREPGEDDDEDGRLPF